MSASISASGGRCSASRTRSERIWRAGVEATIAATLIVFLFAYLNLRRWHVRYTHFALAWLVVMAAVVALSVFNAPVAAGVARISIATVAGVGLLLILSLAARGSDRAVMLIPTWYLLAVWVVAAGAAALGYLTNDLAAPGLVGGLVLIVMLIGFTVMQFAFSGARGGGDSGADAERRSLAMAGSGEAIFDWNVVNDEISGGEALENQLGLKRGALDGPAAGWLDVLHPLDRDRYALALDGLLHQRSGRINHELRLRGADGHYFWYMLKARPVVSADGEVVRVVGSLADVTELKSAEERMLHDAVHDNLTGLPNRELFQDRLDTAIHLAQRPGAARAGRARHRHRRLQAGQRLLRPVDGRFDAARDRPPARARPEARRHARPDRRRPVRRDRPVRPAPPDPPPGSTRCGRRSPPRSASASARSRSPCRSAPPSATRSCTPRAPIFSPTPSSRSPTRRRRAATGSSCSRPRCARMRSDRQTLETDIRHALERGEIMVLFRPIVRLEDRTVAGFQALARWRHPRLGVLDESDFAPAAEATGAAVDIGAFALEATARELAAWQKALEVNPPIFATVAASSRQMLGHDLLTDVRAALTRHFVQRGSLKLAVAGEPGDGEPGICGRPAAAGARDRRGPDARPVRRRLHLARPPAAVPVRRHARRRLARQAERVRPALADPALDRRHGAGDGDGRHLRGRRHRIRRGRTRPDRLPVRARRGVRPADERGRGAEADGGGAGVRGGKLPFEFAQPAQATEQMQTPFFGLAREIREFPPGRAVRNPPAARRSQREQHVGQGGAGAKRAIEPSSR